MAEKPAPESRPQAWFESVRNPGERYPLDEVVYRDQEGGLLQVAHDVTELAKTPAEDWKRLFEERMHATAWPYGSGVWGKKEWVLPDIDNENVVSMYEGHIARGISLGEISIKEILKSDEIEKIETGFSNNFHQSLKDVHSKLKGKYSFGKIRMVQAVHQRMDD